MQRIVKPEILDELPPEDPRAVHSRKDLNRINRIMGHAGLISAHLRESHEPVPLRILELGAGDGKFLLSVLRKLGLAATGGEATLLDRQMLLTHDTQAEYAAIKWNVQVIQTNALDWLTLQTWDLIVCNLFLHHFKEPDLRQILQTSLLISPWIIACEPRRSPNSLRAASLLWALGCNSVTRHDAHVSIRAGFHGREISQLVDNPAFILREKEVGMFTHWFEARRKLT
jgi:hypothetical protein